MSFGNSKETGTWEREETRSFADLKKKKGLMIRTHDVRKVAINDQTSTSGRRMVLEIEPHVKPGQAEKVGPGEK